MRWGVLVYILLFEVDQVDAHVFWSSMDATFGLGMVWWRLSGLVPTARGSLDANESSCEGV